MRFGLIIHVLVINMVLGSFLQLAAQSTIRLTGKVTDEKRQSLSFASVSLPSLNVGTHTNYQGDFELDLPAIDSRDSQVLVRISHVNMAAIDTTIRFRDLHKLLLVQMRDQSLTLQEVQVQAVRERLHSNSSIVFDREAIEQSQAFSLADILNQLPGKKTEAPNLNSPQTAVLRSSADGQNAMNNSFGVAIFIDGVRMNNDANMQAKSLAIRGITGGNIQSRYDSSFDVAYNGFDLRDIPVERIEKIEIIQGVADARYGEMTNGAILITTRAGRTPINVSLRVNGGSTQVTGSKGIQLGGKAGALNISAGYTFSNKDPRDKVKSYQRINSAVQWSVDLTPRLSNTFSFGWDKRLDDVKMDPDDDAELRTFAKGQQFNISERLSWQSKQGFLREAALSFGYSRGRQETYNQRILNGPPRGIADKDTTGIYEGFFIPGNYLAFEQIIGIPVSINGNLNLQSRSILTGNIHHQIQFGASVSSSGNQGPGIIVDPNRPRWDIFNDQRERPVDYSKLVPFLTNLGFYAQENLTGRLLGKSYGLNLGFRVDIQNGFAAYQPRLSFQYQLDKHWGINMAYGISTKAPSLAHRYPAPTWLDIPLLNLYNGVAEESLFLVYTRQVPTDNSQMKAARSRSLEGGITYKGNLATGSLVIYAKKNSDGFGTAKEYIPFRLPVYAYDIDEAHQIHYYPTEATRLYTGVGRTMVTNDLLTNDYGVELMLTTKEIKSLATRFSLSSGFVYSKFNSNSQTIYPVSEENLINGVPALYGIYEDGTRINTTWNSTLGTITHIPKLGFTVNLSMDLSILQSMRQSPGSNRAIAYYDRNMQYIAIPASDRFNPGYDYLKTDLDVMQSNALPFIYPSINLTIAKEIRKNIRLTIQGYNLFNIRPKYLKPGTNSYTVFNTPASITAGVAFKL